MPNGSRQSDCESGPRFSDPVVCFGPWLASMFGSPIRHYADILLSRVMPLFDDIDGEQQRAADEVLNAPIWGLDDYEAAMRVRRTPELRWSFEVEDVDAQAAGGKSSKWSTVLTSNEIDDVFNILLGAPEYRKYALFFRNRVGDYKASGGNIYT